MHWQTGLDKFMREAGQTLEKAREAPKLAKWKLALAARLRNEVDASIEWISSTLSMGKAGSLRSELSRQKSIIIHEIQQPSA
jgi:hypothetical protein